MNNNTKAKSKLLGGKTSNKPRRAKHAYRLSKRPKVGGRKD